MDQEPTEQERAGYLQYLKDWEEAENRWLPKLTFLEWRERLEEKRMLLGHG